MLEKMTEVFTLQWGNGSKQVQTFGESLACTLPWQRTAQPAWGFNFSDQHHLNQSWQSHQVKVQTWVRFDKGWAGRSLAALKRWRLLPWAVRQPWCHSLFANFSAKTPVHCTLAARGAKRQVAVRAYHESEMTALMTAWAIQWVLKHPAKGVVHLHDIATLEDALPALSTLPGYDFIET